MSYILLTGGELFNKGAQAMTFTVVTEIKKRYPDKEIVLLSRKDYERSTDDKNKYNFKILPWNMAIKSYLLGGIYPKIAKLKDSKKYNEFCNIFSEITEILDKTEMMIDISGFSLSSQNTKKSIFGYISNIMVAKKFNVPIWLFPQSFGPFEFGGIYKIINKLSMKKHFKYVMKVFVREKQGYDALKKYLGQDLENIVLMPDIVLQSSVNYSVDSIYSDVNINTSEKIDKNSVAIVPNMQVVKRIGEKHTLELYNNIISDLLDKNKIVYILRHSTEDLDICREIKNAFTDNKNVKLIYEDYSCIELEQIIKHFDYIIGSRYHSIVHAYKNGVPAIAIGWAVKYEELLNRFSQKHFNFDIRDSINVKEILIAIGDMEKSFEDEKMKIQKSLKEIQENDVFSYVEKYYEKNSN